LLALKHWGQASAETRKFFPPANQGIGHRLGAEQTAIHDQTRAVHANS
jgi:hypothetical protein